MAAVKLLCRNLEKVAASSRIFTDIGLIRLSRGVLRQGRLQAALRVACRPQRTTTLPAGSEHRRPRLPRDYHNWLLGEWQKMGGKVIITSDSRDAA